ncbi:MAG: hypothetical protein KAW17_12045 [Candidatus Eisenbacteria sp.]|nr:hypothetical protein [Candidatus Eisenbacteria bacterium]
MKRRTLTSAIFFSILGSLLTPLPADSNLESVELLPARPTVVDSLRVLVHGFLYDGCWNLPSFEFCDHGVCAFPESTGVSDHTLYIHILAVDFWHAGAACWDVWTDYVCSHNFGPLPPGHYSVIVTEHHESLRDPDPEVLTTEFDVIAYALLQNMPNPFNPATRIRYVLPRMGLVDLRVWDAGGHLVRTLVRSQQSAGWNEVTWLGDDNNGNPVASGIYFYRLGVDGRDWQTRKMVLLR